MFIHHKLKDNYQKSSTTATVIYINNSPAAQKPLSIFSAITFKTQFISYLA